MEPFHGKFAISRRSLIILSFLYLFLQTGMFLQGWFTPVVANTLILAILASLSVYFWRFSRADADDLWILKQRDVGYILLAILFVLSVLIIGGIPGWFFPEHSDHYVFRQALYTNLIHAPWPLILPDGREMTYYLAAVLPSAMAARILPDSWQQVPLLLNTLVPLVLATLLFWQRWKKASLLSLIVLFFISEPTRLLFPFSGAPFTENLYGFIRDTFGIKGSIPVLSYFCGNCTLFPPILESYSGYNSHPFSLMVAALLLQLRQSRGLVPLSIALLVPISPLGALALMPIALWVFLSGRRIQLLACIVPLLLAAAVAVYFLRVDSELNAITPSWRIKGMKFWIFYLRYLAGAAFLILPLWPYRKRSPLYIITVFVILFLPLLHIGSRPTGPGIYGINELTLKGGTSYTLLLGSMWCEDWQHINRKFRCCLSAWVAVVILTFLLIQIKSFDLNDCRVGDMWNGHLNHNRLFLKQSIPDVKEPLLPGVLFRTSGESEQHFPGLLLPKADGKCPYGIPPTPNAFP